jgi:hypothetical protein
MAWPNGVNTEYWLQTNSLRLRKAERPENGFITWQVSIARKPKPPPTPPPSPSPSARRDRYKPSSGADRRWDIINGKISPSPPTPLPMGEGTPKARVSDGVRVILGGLPYG